MRACAASIAANPSDQHTSITAAFSLRSPWGMWDTSMHTAGASRSISVLVWSSKISPNRPRINARSERRNPRTATR